MFSWANTLAYSACSASLSVTRQKVWQHWPQNRISSHDPFRIAESVDETAESHFCRNRPEKIESDRSESAEKKSEKIFFVRHRRNGSNRFFGRFLRHLVLSHARQRNLSPETFQKWHVAATAVRRRQFVEPTARQRRSISAAIRRRQFVRGTVGKWRFVAARALRWFGSSWWWPGVKTFSFVIAGSNALKLFTSVIFECS